MNKKAIMLMANGGDRKKDYQDRSGYESWEDSGFYPAMGTREKSYEHRARDYSRDERHPSMSKSVDRSHEMNRHDMVVPHYNKMERMEDGSMALDYSRGGYAPQFDRQMAEEWVAGMENEDGTHGPHWTLEQAKQVMAQKEIGGSPLEFFVALNAMYSDYCKVAKKLGVNTVDFYACMAEAFLNDKDAVGGGAEKLAQYYEHIVQH